MLWASWLVLLSNEQEKACHFGFYDLRWGFWNVNLHFLISANENQTFYIVSNQRVFLDLRLGCKKLLQSLKFNDVQKHKLWPRMKILYRYNFVTWGVQARSVMVQVMNANANEWMNEVNMYVLCVRIFSVTN